MSLFNNIHDLIETDEGSEVKSEADAYAFSELEEVSDNIRKVSDLITLCHKPLIGAVIGNVALVINHQYLGLWHFYPENNRIPWLTFKTTC